MQRQLALGVAALALLPPQAPPAAVSPLPSPPPAPAELVGRVELTDAAGRRTPAAGTVVWIPGVPATAGAETPAMTSREKRFDPHVLAVPAGTTVAFPNVDRIYHNVFSRTAGHEFDLGLYRKGAWRSARFARPGLVRVYCNIHPDMAGYLMVLDGAAFKVTGADGTYRLGGIPPGRRAVRLWNEKGGERELTADFAAGARTTMDVVLDASAYRPQPHKNKFGRDYPPVGRDDDRY